MSKQKRKEGIAFTGSGARLRALQVYPVGANGNSLADYKTIGLKLSREDAKELALRLSESVDQGVEGIVITVYRNDNHITVLHDPSARYVRKPQSRDKAPLSDEVTSEDIMDVLESMDTSSLQLEALNVWNKLSEEEREDIRINGYQQEGD